MRKQISPWSIVYGLWFIIAGVAVVSADTGATLDLEKIIVTPSRYAQPYKNSSVNVNVIEKEEIIASGAAEITQILDTLPAVDILDYGSYGSTKSVHTRGASSANVVTLINGRLVNTPRDGVADHNRIPINNIERIEVLRGPASSIYGANAVGGVINIITKSGKEKMFTELNVRSGSFLTHTADLSHGWKIGRFDYFASTNYIESNGHRDNSDYEQSTHNVKLGYAVNNNNRLVIETGYAASETGTPGRNSDVDLDDRQEQWKDYVDLTWTGSCWRDSKVLLKVYQTLDRLEFIESLSPIHNKDTNQTKVYGADLQISQVWFDILRTSFGTSAQENRLNSSTSAKHEYNFKAGYIETELDFFDGDLTLKGGARVDDYSNFGNKASPSASFSWWFFDKIKTHGLIAKSFRAPTFNDLYWPREDWGAWGGVEGNPNLKPESAMSHEIGLGTYLFGAVETDVTYFYTKFKDMITWTMDDTFWWRPSNVGTAVTNGVETNFNFMITGDLKVNFNYTRLSAINKITEKWLIYRPRHQYKGTLNYNHGKLNCYLTTRYQTKRYTTDTNSRFLKSYFVTDTNISYRVTKFGEITLTVNNILDEDYQEEEDYPMPGTSFMLGVKFTF